MARVSNKILPACLVALAVYSTAQLCFVQPSAAQLRGAALAAALAAASVGGPTPAQADVAKFSVFGFGGGASDPYAQNDNPTNPLSPFSDANDPERSFKEEDKVYLDRKKKALDDSFKRLEKIPALIKTKESENIKSVLTLQVYMMRANMEYVSANGPPFFRDDTTAAFKKSQEFFQDISDLGVAGKQKQWKEAAFYYDKAMNSLKEWKGIVNY